MGASAEVKAFLATFNAMRKANEDAWWHDQLRIYYKNQQANTPAGASEESDARAKAKRAAAGAPDPFTSGSGNGRPINVGDPVSKDFPPHARAFLNAAAAPESGGAYNVRYNGRTPATFEPTGAHPNILVPGPDGPSSAAGRYQITGTTWREYLGTNKLPGDTKFTPENQDKAAWWLANKRYPGLDEKLQKDGLTPDVVKKLGPTWKGFEENPSKALNAYNQSIERYKNPQTAGAIPAPGPKGESSPERVKAVEAERAANPFVPRENTEAVPLPPRRPDDLPRDAALPESVTPGGTPRDESAPSLTPGPSALNQDETNPDYWSTAEANMALPDPVEYAARGGLVRRFADGGLIDESSNAQYWTEENARAAPAPTPTPAPAPVPAPVPAPAPAPREALPVTSGPFTAPDVSEAPAPAGPNISGLPKMLDMGIRAIQRGLGFGDGPSALPPQNTDAAARTLHSGEGAITPQEYAALRRTTDPNNVLSEPVAKMQVMNEMVNLFHERGQPDKARAAAASLIEYSLQVSKNYGKRAIALLQGDDPEGAAKALQNGANEIPAGHKVQIDPKTLQYVITDVRNGKVLQKGAMTHQTLVEAALGMASGGDGFKRLMQTAAEHNKEDATGPSKEYLAQRAAERSGGAKPATASAAPPSAIPPPGLPSTTPGLPTPDVTTPGQAPSGAAPAAGEIPGAKPASTTDEEEEDSAEETTSTTPAMAPGAVAGAPAVAAPPAATAAPQAIPAPGTTPASLPPDGSKTPAPQAQPAPGARPAISYETAVVPRYVAPPRDREPQPPTTGDKADNKLYQQEHSAWEKEWKAKEAEARLNHQAAVADWRAENLRARQAAADLRRDALAREGANQRDALQHKRQAWMESQRELAELRKERRAADAEMAKRVETQTDPAQLDHKERQELLPDLTARINMTIAKALPPEVRGKLDKKFMGPEMDLTEEGKLSEIAKDQTIPKYLGESNHKTITNIAMEIYRYQKSLGLDGATEAAIRLTAPRLDTGDEQARPFEVTPVRNKRTGESAGVVNKRVLVSFAGGDTPTIVVPEHILNSARVVRGALTSQEEKRQAAEAQTGVLENAGQNRGVDARRASVGLSEARTARTTDAAAKRMLGGIPSGLGPVRNEIGPVSTPPDPTEARTALPVGSGPPDMQAYPGAGASELDAYSRKYSPSSRYMKDRQERYSAARGNLATTQRRGDESAVRENLRPDQSSDTLRQAARRIYQAIPVSPR